MMKKFETPDLSKNEEEKKSPGADAGVDLSPKPETVTKMEERADQQKKIRATEGFCAGMDGFKQQYADYKVNVGESEFTLHLQHLEVEGKKVDNKEYSDLKKNLESGNLDIGQVGGFFLMEGKDGVRMTYSIPAKLLLDPESIEERLVNDFSGGATKKREELVPEAKVEKPKTESAEEKSNKDRQVEDASRAATGMGGEVSILAGEGLTSLIVNFPKGRQLRISSTTGALWSGEETDNGRKTALGNRATPREFLLPSERDPGS